MRNDDNCFVRMIFHDRKYSLSKPGMALVRCFFSKNKCIWLLKELVNRSSKFIVREISCMTSIMFMQILDNLQFQWMYSCNDLGSLFRFWFMTGNNHLGLKTP